MKQLLLVLSIVLIGLGAVPMAEGDDCSLVPLFKKEMPHTLDRLESRKLNRIGFSTEEPNLIKEHLDVMDGMRIVREKMRKIRDELQLPDDVWREMQLEGAATRKANGLPEDIDAMLETFTRAYPKTSLSSSNVQLR